MDNLDPKIHIGMHVLCGQVFDGERSLTNEFGFNAQELADNLSYTGPGAEM